jgi:hypothetical protein
MLALVSQLSSLDFSGNALEGRIPEEVGLLTTLVDLDLSGNSLNGPMPSKLGLLSKLSGPMPAQVCSLLDNGTRTLLTRKRQQQ